LAVVSLAVPVLSGKESEARQFGAGIKQRKNDWEKSEKRLRLKKEAWFLQQSPQGSMLIVYIEGNDVGKALSDFAKSRDPFDAWFKDEVKAISGVDLNQPAGPPPELLFSYGY
jgi:uncharacterized protein DUF6176